MKTAEELAAEVEYLKAEAKKAFDARDEIKGKLREVEGRAISPEDAALFKALRDERQKVEDDRKRAAGEFDAILAQRAKEAADAIAAEQAKAAKLTEQYHTQLRTAAFASANELFGGATARTILDPAMAMTLLGPHVSVDTDASGAPHVVVKKADGTPITGASGSALPFSEAIAKLIEELPNKDRILRGGGKAGSGSSGAGHGATHTVDLSALTAADFSDPDVRAAVRREQSAKGALRFGSAFDQITAAAAKGAGSKP